MFVFRRLTNNRSDAVAQDTIHVLIGDAIGGALVFCCAILAAVGSDQIGDGNRLLGALVGTIALASLGQLVLQPLPQLSGRSQLQDLRRLLLDVVATCLPLSILAFAVPTGVNFVCEPMVPWSIWAGIFGAFATSFLGTATARPGPTASTTTISIFRVEHLKRAPQPLREFTRSAPRGAASSGLLPSNSAIFFAALMRCLSTAAVLRVLICTRRCPGRSWRSAKLTQSAEICGRNMCDGS